MLIAVGLCVAAPAFAFHEVESYDRSANAGGGAGYYYTGSRRFRGYDCNICHVNADKRISIELGGNLTGGTYEPGLIYTIEVKLVGEHRGLDAAFNPNTFAADITDAAGAPVGFFSAGAGNIVEAVDDGHVAVAEGFGNGESQWSFSWWAPDQALPARLHIALLDGDGANDPDRRFIDPLNDDVATLQLDLCPVGVECAEPEVPDAPTSPAGCSVPGEPAAPTWLILLMLALLRAGFRHSKPWCRGNDDL